jgi:PPOX class probable F420-dependent enzyme
MGKPGSDTALWDVVRQSRRGILATISPNGLPHLTNVHYLVDDEQERVIRVTTTTTRVKGSNVLREPRAALHVQDDDWFAFAVVEGGVTTAVAESVGDVATNELHDIFTAFRGPQERPEFDEKMILAKRMIVRLSVDRLYGLAPRQSANDGVV